MDDDQEEAEMKKLIELRKFKVLGVHSMLKDFDREDLETLWKIVKARHGYIIPEEGYKRVLWGRIVGIKRLHDDLRVTVAQLVLLVQSYNCLLRVNAAGTKITTAQGFGGRTAKKENKIDWRIRYLCLYKLIKIYSIGINTSPRYKNDNQTGQFGNQRTVTVVGARETVGSQETKKDTDEETDEQELEAHYSFMAKIKEVPTADLGTDTRPLEQLQNDAEYNMFAN
ncbi:hypothetical protein Tco_1150577, partial [Tanacetum coccineum]